jgi:hypothetical protein
MGGGSGGSSSMSTRARVRRSPQRRREAFVWFGVVRSIKFDITDEFDDTRVQQ